MVRLMGVNVERVWVITRHRFEHDESTAGFIEFEGLRVPVTSGIMRRHEEVERLAGDLSEAEVARHLELKYARLYQPKWDELTSTVDEAARRGPDGGIVVGHEPEFVARLVEGELF